MSLLVAGAPVCGLLTVALLSGCGADRPLPVFEGEAEGIRFEAAGSGPAVVLIHGGGLDSRMWNESFHALARSYRVVRHDVRGFGRSAPPTAPFSHVDDLARVLDRAGIDSAALVGLSLGGAIALNFALVHPDRVDRLLLIGPAVPGAAIPAEEPVRFQRIARLSAEGRTAEAVEEWLGSVHMASAMADERIAAEVRSMAMENHRSWAPGNVQSHPVVPPAATRLHEIRAPTHVLVGERDDRSVHEQALLVAEGVPGARIDFVPDAGHIVNLEAPAAFTRWLLRGLEGHQGRSSAQVLYPARMGLSPVRQGARRRRSSATATTSAELRQGAYLTVCPCTIDPNPTRGAHDYTLHLERVADW